MGTLTPPPTPPMVGDSGAGGPAGTVPAPAAGDAAAAKFLKASGTWEAPTGTTPAAHATSHLSGGSDPVGSTIPAASKFWQFGSTTLPDMLAVGAALGGYHIGIASSTGSAVSTLGMNTPAFLGTSSVSGAYLRRTGAGGTGGRTNGSQIAQFSLGFHCSIRFRLPSTIGARRIWIGMMAAGTEADAADIGLEFAGFRYSSVEGDAGWRPCSRDASTQSVGTAFGALVADVPYLAIVSCARGASTIQVEMIRMDTGAREVAALSSNLPQSTTPLGPVFMAYNQTVSKDFDWSQICLLAGLN